MSERGCALKSERAHHPLRHRGAVDAGERERAGLLEIERVCERFTALARGYREVRPRPPTAGNAGHADSAVVETIRENSFKSED